MYFFFIVSIRCWVLFWLFFFSLLLKLLGVVTHFMKINFEISVNFKWIWMCIAHNAQWFVFTYLSQAKLFSTKWKPNVMAFYISFWFIFYLIMLNIRCVHFSICDMNLPGIRGAYRLDRSKCESHLNIMVKSHLFSVARMTLFFFFN